MDNDEVNKDDPIDKLLDALDGIEQCFVVDFDEKKRKPVEHARKHRKASEVFTPVNVKRKAIDSSLFPRIPSEKVTPQDPRLQKLCIASPVLKSESKKRSSAPIINSSGKLNVDLKRSCAATVSLNLSHKALHLPVKIPLEPIIPTAPNKNSKDLKKKSEINCGNATNFPHERKTGLQNTAILKTVKKSGPKEVSASTTEKQMVPQKPEKPFTQVTRCTPKNGSSSHSKESATSKKLPEKNMLPNNFKKTNIKTVPFRKPEKLTDLPLKRPAKLPAPVNLNNKLSDVDLFAQHNNLNRKKKVPDLSHKRSGKSAENVDLSIEKLDSEKVSCLPKKPIGFLEMLKLCEDQRKPKSNSASAADRNAKNVSNLLNKFSMLKKSTNTHTPFENSKEPNVVMSVSIGDSNAKEDLNLAECKTIPSISQDSAREIGNNVGKSSDDKITKQEQVICRTDSPLPTEILIKIFKYLSVNERKSAKLVCKCWYDTCSIKLFMLRQRFVCCGNYDTTSILQTLTKSQCECFNLEFYRVNFCDSFNEYWKQIGPKIHALYFVDCVIGEETFGDVIINCTEMQCFSLSFEYLKVPSIKIFTLTLFENLYKQRIERKKVVSFDLKTNSNGWFSNAILSNLFAIFPNVSRLGFTCHSLNPVADGVEAVAPCDIDFSDLWSSKSLTFSPILKRIVCPSDSLEKLALDLHTKGQRTEFAWQSVIMHSTLTRLREIVMEVDLRKLSGNAVIEFCCNQKELKSLNCKIIGSAKLFISLFLLKLLDSCPRLRHLSVAYKSSFLMSNELFRGLINSKLRSLRIESNVLLAPQITDELAWPTNEYLRSLSLSDDVGKDLKNLLIVIFCKLTFLEIHDLSDDILQLIWKVQTNLVALKLSGVEECTIDGFCGVPENTSFSIRNLQELEYLVIEAVNYEWQVYGNVFSEFKFPKLRYFCVDIEGSTTLYNDLLDAVMDFSELEALSITCSGVERSSWLKLNKSWKKLRYLRIVDKQSDRFKVKQYCNFFKASSSLRALVHEFKSSTESYYYDILDKMVKRKIYRAKYRINSEKVGEFSPNYDHSLLDVPKKSRFKG